MVRRGSRFLGLCTGVIHAAARDADGDHGSHQPYSDGEIHGLPVPPLTHGRIKSGYANTDSDLLHNCPCVVPLPIAGAAAARLGATDIIDVVPNEQGTGIQNYDPSKDGGLLSVTRSN